MSVIMLFFSVVIFLCIITNKFSNKLGMPALLFFMFLGVLFGSDGILKISYSDYELTSKLCSIGLIFIIFYGGFCTKKFDNNNVTIQAGLLSSMGTVLTALFTCIFCYFVLRIPFAESFLIGAIISSTDAASVFSILRSKKLNLKYDTAPLLEMESGSNDPFAYMLTVLGVVLLNGGNIMSLTPVIFAQIGYGILFGVLIAFAGIYIFQRTKLLSEGTDTLFMVAISLVSFAIPDMLGGNGFLSVYITGIIIGNSEINNKINLIDFFDSITALAQIIIFFLIGFLSFPHKIPEILFPALLITIFLSFIARPLAVSIVLLPFRAKWNQILFISWAGLRGASSIVFAIMTVAESSFLKYDLFHIVFVVVLLSVAFQGSLLPYIAKRSKMLDRYSDVRKTFNDYQQESAITLNTQTIDEKHPWKNCALKDINLSDNSLVLIVNRNGQKIFPKGDTILENGDEVLIGTTVIQARSDIRLCETYIDKNHEWINKNISDIHCQNDFLIALVKREKHAFVPNGETKIQLGDTIIFYAS